MTLFRLVLGFGILTMAWIFADTHHHIHSHDLKDQQMHLSQTILEAMHMPMMNHNPSESKSVEVDYLHDMIPHHQGAVDSATILLPYITNDKLKILAQNIIQSQTEEIAMFNVLLENNTFSNTQVSPSTYSEFLEANKIAMNAMMNAMSAIKPTNNFQKDFILAMIAHHNGAIRSSKIVLSYTKDPQIQQIARKIIAAQEDEVALMQNLSKEF